MQKLLEETILFDASVDQIQPQNGEKWTSIESQMQKILSKNNGLIYKNSLRGMNAATSAICKNKKNLKLSPFKLKQNSRYLSSSRSQSPKQVNQEDPLELQRVRKIQEVHSPGMKHEDHIKTLELDLIVQNKSIRMSPKKSSRFQDCKSNRGTKTILSNTHSLHNKYGKKSNKKKLGSDCEDLLINSIQKNIVLKEDNENVDSIKEIPQSSENKQFEKVIQCEQANNQEKQKSRRYSFETFGNFPTHQQSLKFQNTKASNNQNQKHPIKQFSIQKNVRPIMQMKTLEQQKQQQNQTDVQSSSLQENDGENKLVEFNSNLPFRKYSKDEDLQSLKQKIKQAETINTYHENSIFEATNQNILRIQSKSMSLPGKPAHQEIMNEPTRWTRIEKAKTISLKIALKAKQTFKAKSSTEYQNQIAELKQIINKKSISQNLAQNTQLQQPNKLIDVTKLTFLKLSKYEQSKDTQITKYDFKGTEITNINMIENASNRNRHKLKINSERNKHDRVQINNQLKPEINLIVRTNKKYQISQSAYLPDNSNHVSTQLPQIDLHKDTESIQKVYLSDLVKGNIKINELTKQKCSFRQRAVKSCFFPRKDIHTSHKSEIRESKENQSAQNKFQLKGSRFSLNHSEKSSSIAKEQNNIIDNNTAQNKAGRKEKSKERISKGKQRKQTKSMTETEKHVSFIKLSLNPHPNKLIIIRN